MSSIKLIKGDCVTELDKLPDKTVQLICIDLMDFHRFLWIFMDFHRFA